MTDKSNLGNTNVEKLIAEMLDQAMLDPYLLDFTKGYERGVHDAMERSSTILYNTFLVMRKQNESPPFARFFDALEYRLVQQLLKVRTDLLRF